MSTNFSSVKVSKIKNFIGKKEIIRSIEVGIEVAKKTNNALDHILFYGPPGVGKTSLAQIIANEMDVKIKIIQSTNIQSLPDLISILSSLKNHDILFIDEIHSLKHQIAEILYPALEENVLDVLVGKNYNSKVIRIKLPKFTLIAATTNFGSLSKALEERFGYIYFIDLYSKEEMKEIIKKNVKNLMIEINDYVENIIIENARGIPRNCNRILKRIKNYQIIKKEVKIHQIIKECGYLYKGISEIDYKYLKFLSKNENSTAGLKSIVQGINLDEKTLLNKVEPYLINQRYITKIFKGRSLTKKGIKFLAEIKEHLLKENVSVQFWK